MMAPASPLEASAAAALASGAGGAAFAQDALLFAARAGGRAFGERDVAAFRAHYAAVASEAAAAGAGAGAGAESRARAGFSPESRALLASLGALRCGLQALEQRRRRWNAVLGREPATFATHADDPHTSKYAV